MRIWIPELVRWLREDGCREPWKTAWILVKSWLKVKLRIPRRTYLRSDQTGFVFNPLILQWNIGHRVIWQDTAEIKRQKRLGSMTGNDLKQLRSDTEEALKRVLSRKEQIGGAVNWADLHCTEASYSICDDGSLPYTYPQVVIEEADPDAVELQNAVAEELRKMGWPDVHVVTEW